MQENSGGAVRPATATRTVRAVRAFQSPATLTVYQAYPPAIADRAVRHGTFVAPFKRERMTWIKPSFLWMMYRSGWAQKPGQERVLAVEITRAGFDWALARAALSHFDRAVHADRDAWRAAVRESPVRVQWDPDRTVRLEPLPRRAIQVGLSGAAVERYADEWITGITDITPAVTSLHDMLRREGAEAVRRLLPEEQEYPLPEATAKRLGADVTGAAPS